MPLFRKTPCIDPPEPPPLKYRGFVVDCLHQSHTLIGGATGSGKSALLRALLISVLTVPGDGVGLVLIDPKRVELSPYRYTRQCKLYASEPDEIIAALKRCITTMESIYKDMQRQGLRESRTQHIYVVIDELADLMTTSKKEVTPLLCRLTQLGRAARFHIIAATQRPTRSVIDGQIKVNITCNIALHTINKQDSRNIIGLPGAELLPMYGEAIYTRPGYIGREAVPYYTAAEEKLYIDYNTPRKKKH